MFPINGPTDAKTLARELENFQEIAKHLLPRPGETPRLNGFDVYGGTLALNGQVGGDHLIYVDFKQRFDLEGRIRAAAGEGRLDVVDNLVRCQQTAGIALVDVSGHRVTDALLAAMLHQAFLVGAIYELDMFGQITSRLFETLNTRFYQTSGAHKFISLLYGEISEDARLRFLSAGQPFPLVFSYEHERFMDIGPALCVSFPPLGIMPSLHAVDRHTDESLLGFKDRYQLNEWTIMGAGDIVLLHTDGFADHCTDHEAYVPVHLEETLRRVKHAPAQEIFVAVMNDLVAFAPPADDVSVVVIRWTGPV
jgi:serine phosphatase RsbU (regulator of sigma subunit)